MDEKPPSYDCLSVKQNNENENHVTKWFAYNFKKHNIQLLDTNDEYYYFYIIPSICSNKYMKNTIIDIKLFESLDFIPDEVICCETYAKMKLPVDHYFCKLVNEIIDKATVGLFFKINIVDSISNRMMIILSCNNRKLSYSYLKNIYGKKVSWILSHTVKNKLKDNNINVTGQVLTGKLKSYNNKKVVLTHYYTFDIRYN